MSAYTGDVNSIINQDIKSKFVGREVFCNVNTMVDYILKKSHEDGDAPFSYDDIENLIGPETVADNQFRYTIDLDERGEFKAHFDRINEDGEDGDTILEITNEEAAFLSDEGVDIRDGEAVAEYYFDLKGEVFGIKSWGSITILDATDEVNMEAGEEYEVYEWWAVSGWLYRKLKAAGYPVLDGGSVYLWGRTTTGQAILLDSAISQICIEMGILEGQSNQWT
ncbi:hypothetical protein [Spirosoma sordidisoli]|uniref:Uncharacterized protein n=1 Tax=Spirosoma sordidisoli TaxID=2502893 RepID=A0A4Q2UP74_9BACT|nr:hypothetical protein [Spirosoma sordidisoli]RYC69591.1 hypothetical protein EQG79_13390 [Spirosoma sordidisoli]